VLNNYHRVAQVPQPFEGAQQPGIVALVQTDAGFVENIQDPPTRPDLGREANPLSFAAAQVPLSRSSVR